MAVTITNVRYALDQGYSYLLMQIDGVEAAIMREQKPTLLEQRILYLGPGWGNLTPPIRFKDDNGTVHVLEGFTQEPAILAEFDRFAEAVDSGKFEPGPRDSLY